MGGSFSVACSGDNRICYGSRDEKKDSSPHGSPRNLEAAGTALNGDGMTGGERIPDGTNGSGAAPADPAGVKTLLEPVHTSRTENSDQGGGGETEAIFETSKSTEEFKGAKAAKGSDSDSSDSDTGIGVGGHTRKYSLMQNRRQNTVKVAGPGGRKLMTQASTPNMRTGSRNQGHDYDADDTAPSFLNGRGGSRTPTSTSRGGLNRGSLPVSLTDRSERDRPSGSALNMFARNSITMGAGDKQQQQARVRALLMDPAENDEQREMVSELERQAIAQMEALETAASSFFYKSSRNLHTPSGGSRPLSSMNLDVPAGSAGSDSKDPQGQKGKSDQSQSHIQADDGELVITIKVDGVDGAPAAVDRRASIGALSRSGTASSMNTRTTLTKNQVALISEKVRENIERRENEVFERTGTRTLSELARSESNVNKTPQTAVLSSPKPSPAQPEDSAAVKRRRLRRTVALELLSTEETYVYRLQTLMDVYIAPLETALEKKETWVSRSDVDTIFSTSFTQILSINEAFLLDLANAMGETDEDEIRVGTLLTKIAPQFKQYSNYIANLEAATNFLSRTLMFGAGDSSKAPKRYERLAEFLREGQFDPRCEGQDLQSFLILPIQRIPRYKLLILELLKNTDKEITELLTEGSESSRKIPNPEYEALTEALEAIQDVAHFINESVRQQQRNAEVQSIQEQFFGNVNLVSPGRYLVKQGPLDKVSRRRNNSYEFFLFSDLLVYASKVFGPGLRKYRLKFQAPIDRTVAIRDNFSTMNLDSDDERVTLQFKILTHAKSFLVVARDKLDKTAWLNAFDTVLGLRDAEIAKAKALADGIVSDPDTRQRSKSVSGKKKRKPKVSGPTGSKNRLKRAITLDDGTLRRQAPIMEQYRSGAVCHVCGLSANFIQRRHCKNCGHVVHDECSKTKMYLPGSAEKDTKRVCDKCVVLIKHQMEEEIVRANTARSAKGDPSLEDDEKEDVEVSGSEEVSGSGATESDSASDGDDTGRRIRRSSESTSQVVTNTSGLDGSKTDRSDSIVVRSESMASVPATHDTETKRVSKLDVDAGAAAAAASLVSPTVKRAPPPLPPRPVARASSIDITSTAAAASAAAAVPPRRTATAFAFGSGAADEDVPSTEFLSAPTQASSSEKTPSASGADAHELQVERRISDSTTTNITSPPAQAGRFVSGDLSSGSAAIMAPAAVAESDSSVMVITTTAAARQTSGNKVVSVSEVDTDRPPASSLSLSLAFETPPMFTGLGIDPSAVRPPSPMPREYTELKAVAEQSEGRDTFASQDATIISEPPPPPAEESQDHHSDHSADDNAQHDAEDRQDDQASDHSVRVHDAAAAQTQHGDDQGETGEQEYQAEDADNDDGTTPADVYDQKYDDEEDDVPSSLQAESLASTAGSSTVPTIVQSLDQQLQKIGQTRGRRTESQPPLPHSGLRVPAVIHAKSTKPGAASGPRQSFMIADRPSVSSLVRVFSHDSTAAGAAGSELEAANPFASPTLPANVSRPRAQTEAVALPLPTRSVPVPGAVPTPFVIAQEAAGPAGVASSNFLSAPSAAQPKRLSYADIVAKKSAAPAPAPEPEPEPVVAAPPASKSQQSDVLSDAVSDIAPLPPPRVRGASLTMAVSPVSSAPAQAVGVLTVDTAHSGDHSGTANPLSPSEKKGPPLPPRPRRPSVDDVPSGWTGDASDTQAVPESGRHARAMSVGASPAALAAPATASASASIDTAAKRGDGGAAITAAEYKELQSLQRPRGPSFSLPPRPKRPSLGYGSDGTVTPDEHQPPQ